MLFSGTVCCGQTVSKESKCVEHWEMDCEAAKNVTQILALYPTQMQKIGHLESLIISQKSLYNAKTDSLSNVFVKKIQKSDLKTKKARFWGNIKPVAVLIGIILIK
jgi:hypothetical protein